MPLRWPGGLRPASRRDLRPDGLAREPFLPHTPALSQRLHEEQAAPGLGGFSGVPDLREPFTAGVGHLDAERGADQVQRQAEGASRNAAVGGGVRGQLGHEEVRGLDRQPPAAQLRLREQPGEAGTARGGRQQNAEVGDGRSEFGGSPLGDFLIHVTQRGRIRLPW